eukprot:TRINITY_DN5999_c0_g1::TRINITY_DN5999_c0_g1_i1::g.9861::m.9861 TRINITY_DN5999_c0_g1::TRINITY_DN5999_c0_g1_i1::g.9861  ORF type:complete len:649 (+),score=76.14,sp/Q28D01/WDR26_XENTR/37.95/1e-119,WD40/PF00400.27/1.1e-09,WD40/PF00400.27/1.1e-09,WD40/PF00400.27/6.2e-07,WD40/PF00400.27/2.2e+02,WD40/PF00400.27/5e+03,WD40/PF00400.27/1.7,WD40/PF00400.27/1.4e-11,eIF2A/PF08662.6/0.015,eIF2A/PF08662.6/1.4e+02,CLTH/PF10607.4/0.017 TRINITY_DN5999_c0_g1_i1:3-1949(+)
MGIISAAYFSLCKQASIYSLPTSEDEPSEPHMSESHTPQRDSVCPLTISADQASSDIPSSPPRKRARFSSNQMGSERGGEIEENGTHHQDAEERVLRGQFKQSELVRIMIQSLYSLGYSSSAKHLEEESKLMLQRPQVTKFTQFITRGEWDQAIQLLPSLGLAQEKEIKAAKFLIAEQKFLELLEQGSSTEALMCLRQELAPSRYDKASETRLHKLTSLVMCRDANELHQLSGWNGKNEETRKGVLQRLQAFVSPSLLLPEDRLLTLISQAIDHQRNQCLYHNTREPYYSLLEDHACTMKHLPRKTTHVLEEHSDEVWYIQFSHDGTRLASASKDCSVIVWDVTSPEITVKFTLTLHNKPLSFLAWSHDDKYLVTCGNDKTIRLWDMTDGSCLKLYDKHTDAVTTCAWLSDSRRFVSGGLDKNIFEWDIHGNLLRKWTGTRINDLAITNDDSKMLVVSDKKIRIYDLTAASEECEDTISEVEAITSLVLSDDSQYALVNISSQEIHLWSLKDKCLVQKYRGHRQGRYVIRSTFGGINQAFVISGSEDSQVYLWQRGNGTHLLTLPGHSGTVNDVSWNPTNPYMFASASDDHTIRIWGVDENGGEGMGLEPVQQGMANGHANGSAEPNGHGNGVASRRIASSAPTGTLI